MEPDGEAFERSRPYRKGTVLGGAAIRKLVLGFSFVSSTACAHVPAYERGKLADPSMTTRDMATPAEAHVHAVQEGAVGGGDATGGGCGCN